MNEKSFNVELAKSCAKSFHISSGLGCTIADIKGNIIQEYGRGFNNCPICQYAGCSKKDCVQTHIYGTLEAERFGGKYIYFCPFGLTCFVSPIIGEEGTSAIITAGPFIMVDRQEFIDVEIKENKKITEENLDPCISAVEEIPSVSPYKVTELSNLLFMAVGFMNNVSAESRLLETDRVYYIQSHINSYVSELKNEGAVATYPFGKEQALLKSIARGDKDLADKQLEELLSELFLMGNNLKMMKARGYEIIVMISRVAMENGTDIDKALSMCQQYLEQGEKQQDFSEYCLWLSKTVRDFIDSMFGFSDSKHANIIHRCIQFIGVNYAENLTLEKMANMVYMSPFYLSRVFKRETGSTFNQYLNKVRINKAKDLLHNRELKLCDISIMVGYEDQSYFTRVFKKITGISPLNYRNKVLSNK